MKRILFFIVVLSTFSVTLAMSFKPPTTAERLAAIGSTEGLAKTLRKALDPVADFEPIPIPKPGDWLAVHRETGQSFDNFVKSKSNQPDKIRSLEGLETGSKIYLQPLGEFRFPPGCGGLRPDEQSGVPPKGQIPLVERLREVACAYFAMQVEVLPCLALNDNTITTRINPFTQNRQILTSDVLTILKKNIPADAFCVLAITMEDLYPEPSWNFVFGQASLRERVGVYSFARYSAGRLSADPAFYGEKRRAPAGSALTSGKDYENIVLRRSCKVLAHETAHMFGLKHCIYFKCVLNGSNHLKESDSRPMHLCPVCLRKLQYSIGFDVVSRYGNLFRFYKSNGFDDEGGPRFAKRSQNGNPARWLANRLEWIVGAEEARRIIERKNAD